MTQYDVRGAGVIAEIFSSTHEPTFSYAELLKYRKEREGFPLVRKTPPSTR